MNTDQIPPIEYYKGRELMRLVRIRAMDFRRTEGKPGWEGYVEQWDAGSGATYINTYLRGKYRVYRMWADGDRTLSTDEELGTADNIIAAGMLALSAEALYFAELSRLEDILGPSAH